MKNGIIIWLLCCMSTVWAQNEAQVTFTPKGGKFEGEVTVKLSAGNDAPIYYTLDGSIPTSGANRYTKPISVENIAVIRAVAYVNGKRTPVNTQSYFCDRAYTLPVISITTNPENLWDFSTGMYVMGCCADTIEPYQGANFWKDWEKPANIEMYTVKGKCAFNQNVGINIFGGYSRMLPQKSIAVFARKKYGDNRLRYPIFKARDMEKYKSFILRNSGGDFRRTHFRDAYMTQLAKPTGVAIQEYEPAIVFLNGEYWGIQNMREKINEHYLHDNYDVDKDNVDILRHNAVARHGNSRNYKKLLAFLRTQDMTKDKTIEELSVFMDIDDYLRYNIAEVYSDNRDAGGNIRYWRERKDSAKWRWIFYDLDLGLGNNEPNGYKRNTLKKFTSANAEAWPDPAWSTFIIRSLLSNEKVKIRYINMFADHLNTVYKEERALDLIDSIQEPLKAEMKYHVKRWKTSYENWEHHIDIVRHFVRERPKYLREFLMEKFDLKNQITVSIKYPGKEKAKVKFNTLKIKNDFEGIYFTGVPVTISVKPRHDYVFKGWKNRAEKTEELTIVPTENLVLEPLFEPRKRSIYTDSIIFNEMCVHQPDGDTTQDWIELYNRSNTDIVLGNWRFTDATYKEGYILPENTTLKAKQFLLLAEEKDHFLVTYPADSLHIIGGFDFGLSKEKEHLKLYDEEGNIVDSLSYKFDEQNWDTLASIHLIHPDSARSNMKNWKVEKVSPGGIGDSYKAFLKGEADKRYWTRIYYIGGGSFFFILVVGILFYQYSKKRKKRRA